MQAAPYFPCISSPRALVRASCARRSRRVPAVRASYASLHCTTRLYSWLSVLHRASYSTAPRTPPMHCAARSEPRASCSHFAPPRRIALHVFTLGLALCTAPRTAPITAPPALFAGTTVLLSKISFFRNSSKKDCSFLPLRMTNIFFRKKSRKR